jgi:hypothetical protein
MFFIEKYCDAKPILCIGLGLFIIIKTMLELPYIYY